MAKEIKFAEILQSVLDRRGAKETRQKICSSLHISQSAITQYLHGHSSPKLKTIVDLAGLLAVDLNYLVFGEDTAGYTPERDFSDVVTGIQQGVSSIHQKLDAHQWVLSRITSLVLEEMEIAAKRVLKDCKATGGALIHDDDLMRLEPLSHETLIVRRTLLTEIPHTNGDTESPRDWTTGGVVPPGRFLTVVAKSLGEGNRYVYVIPQHEGAEAEVEAFTGALRHQGVTEKCLSNCSFWKTAAPLITGFIVYRFELDSLDASRRLFVEPFLLKKDASVWLGCSLPPSPALQANPLMDSAHVEHALQMRDLILRDAKLIPGFGDHPSRPQGTSKAKRRK